MRHKRIELISKDIGESMLDLGLYDDLPDGVSVEEIELDGKATYEVIVPARCVAGMIRLARKHDHDALADFLELYTEL